MPADTFTHDEGAPGSRTRAPDDYLPAPDGAPVIQDDRLTIQLMAQYAEWNAPATVLQFATTRMVDESASPVVKQLKIPVGGIVTIADMVVFLGRDTFDLIILNRTGWVHHTAPELKERTAMRAAGTGLAIGFIMPDGTFKQLCKPAPGLFTVLPQASPDLALQAVGRDFAGTAYLMPY